MATILCATYPFAKTFGNNTLSCGSIMFATPYFVVDLAVFLVLHTMQGEVNSLWRAKAEHLHPPSPLSARLHKYPAATGPRSLSSRASAKSCSCFDQKPFPGRLKAKTRAKGTADAKFTKPVCELTRFRVSEICTGRVWRWWHRTYRGIQALSGWTPALIACRVEYNRSPLVLWVYREQAIHKNGAEEERNTANQPMTSTLHGHLNAALASRWYRPLRNLIACKPCTGVLGSGGGWLMLCHPAWYPTPIFRPRCFCKKTVESAGHVTRTFIRKRMSCLSNPGCSLLRMDQHSSRWSVSFVYE